MGKTRDLFKKIRDTKGTFHAKMGTIKDRNGIDLTEAEDINKRQKEYIDELYRKDLHDPDNHDGVITHLEPDILECEVKCALGSITTNKASGGDGIPVELFDGDLTSMAPHERLPEYPIVPREKTHSGAAVREKPQDAPVNERWGPSFPA